MRTKRFLIGIILIAACAITVLAQSVKNYYYCAGIAFPYPETFKVEEEYDKEDDSWLVSLNSEETLSTVVFVITQTMDELLALSREYQMIAMEVVMSGLENELVKESDEILNKGELSFGVYGDLSANQIFTVIENGIKLYYEQIVIVHEDKMVFVSIATESKYRVEELQDIAKSIIW